MNPTMFLWVSSSGLQSQKIEMIPTMVATAGRATVIGDFHAKFYLLMTDIPGARAVTTAQLPSQSESICHAVFWWNR